MGNSKSMTSQEKDILDQLDYKDDHLRIVLVGRTGVGKSTTGNRILLNYSRNKQEGQIFESKAFGTSVTQECSDGKQEVFGQKLVIVDTPGLFDTVKPNKQILQEIAKFLLYCYPGPHAIILVMAAQRLSQEYQSSIEILAKLFKDNMKSHFIILFTGKDALDDENIKFEEFIQTVPKSMKKFFDSCGNRIIAFDNRASVAANEEQVKIFLRELQSLVSENQRKGQRYCQHMYIKEAAKVASLAELRKQVRNGECTFYQKVLLSVREVFG